MRRYLLPLAMLAVIVAVLVWAWTRLPAHKPNAVTVPAARATYDGSQPLRLAVVATGDDVRGQRLAAWLHDEVDYWMAHASGLRYDRGGLSREPSVFTLQLHVQTAPATQLHLRLVEPGSSIAREETVTLQDIGLPFAATLTQLVPRFLHVRGTWEALLGTSNAEHYAAVVAAREHLRESASEQRAVNDIGALERVTRSEKGYARAWSTLALAYAHMQSEDSTSLDALALSAAERAIALDTAAAEAQAVRGHIQYRRGLWLAAHEQLLHALQLQPAEPLALRALACLLVDAGHAMQALPLAQRAARLLPLDGEVRECLSYARAAVGASVVEPNDPPLPFAAARVVATVQILEGDLPAARQTYETALAREHRSAPWLNALLSAAGDRTQTVAALREITSGASEKLVDPSTEVLAGIALERSDFVVNRLLRLQNAKEYVPLRVLWLPQTPALRNHARCDDVIRASDLPTFWARHGKPDVCANEPAIAICR